MKFAENAQSSSAQLGRCILLVDLGQTRLNRIDRNQSLYRRVRNDRIKRELGVTLKYPTYREGLKALQSSL